MNLATPRWLRWTLVLWAIALAAVPALLYWALVARHPVVLPQEVPERIAAGDALVDVRDPPGPPLAGAAVIPLSQVLAVRSEEQLPKGLRGRRLILVCQSGVSSGVATGHLRGLGLAASNLAGGLEAWHGTVPRLDEPAWKQWLVVLTGFVVKPLYMLLSLALAIALRRATTPGTVGLRRALWAFFLGEAFCALNYAVFHEDSLLTDMLHSWGMALAAGFGTWAVAAGAMRHLLPENGRCGFDSLCQPCTARSGGLRPAGGGQGSIVPLASSGSAPRTPRAGVCRHERVLPLAAAMLLFSALVPLTAPCQPIAATTCILGTPYAYGHAWAQTVFELRACPLAAIALALPALGLALARRGGPALVLLCAASGPLAFAFFRLVLVAAWRDDPAWFLAWEELGELATVLAAAWWLRIFRRSAP